MFSNEHATHAIASERRREIHRRKLPCSVERRGRCVFLTNHAFRSSVEDELAQLFDGLVKSVRSEIGPSPAELN